MQPLALRRPAHFAAGLILLPLILVCATPLSSAQKLALGASLDGGAVVPSSPSTAVGTATVEVDLDLNKLTFNLTHTGLLGTEISASIHGYAAPGGNAPALFSLPLGFHKTGVWSYPQADEAAIITGLSYVEIASSSFLSGEIRGQLYRDSSSVSMTSELDGQQEVPPNVTPAKGSAHCAIDVHSNKFTFLMTWDGIASPQTAGHIHGPALPGQTNGVKFALPNNSGNHQVGVWNYDQADEADILAGLMYFNVHSDAFLTGEIRGQILALSTNPAPYCTAKTTSLGCIPVISSSGEPSASAGSGFVITTAPVPGGNTGIFFYGKSGPAAAPFQGAFLCVQPPALRTPASNSGGTPGLCDGAYSIDFNAYIASGVDPALVTGANVNLQAWFRDPPDPVSGTGLSAALMFEIRG